MIWVGAEALSKGLVDAIGGIEEAAQEAARLAGFKAKDGEEAVRMRLVEYAAAGGAPGGGAVLEARATLGAIAAVAKDPLGALANAVQAAASSPSFSITDGGAAAARGVDLVCEVGLEGGEVAAVAAALDGARAESSSDPFLGGSDDGGMHSLLL